MTFGVAAFAQAPFAATAATAYAASISEAATSFASAAAKQAYFAATTNSATAADAARSKSIVFGAVADSAFGNAAALAAAGFVCRLSATASAVCTLTGLPTYATRVVEYGQGTNAVSATLSAIASINTAATGFDRTSCIFVFPSFVENTATAAGSSSATGTYPASLSDEVLANTSLAAQLTLPAQVSEQVQAVLNSVVATAAVLATVAENVTAVDVLLGSFLWNPIDDQQIPGWTDILIPRTISSDAVFGGSGFADVAFAGGIKATYGPAGTNWTLIDDEQTPNWTPIDAV